MKEVIFHTVRPSGVVLTEALIPYAKVGLYERFASSMHGQGYVNITILETPGSLYIHDGVVEPVPPECRLVGIKSSDLAKDRAFRRRVRKAKTKARKAALRDKPQRV